MLVDGSGEAGTAELSSRGHLHDLALVCEVVTSGGFKRRGTGLAIAYAVHDSPFGRALIGVSERGLCWLGFVAGGDESRSLRELEGDWPAARLVHDPAAVADPARRIFARAAGARLERPLPVLLRGTSFQIKVWKALLAIPSGAVASYQDVARAIGSPAAVRAVGRAVGANPISLVIPCHRVTLKSGVVHNYRWGVDRKRTILALEAAQEPGLSAAPETG